MAGEGKRTIWKMDGGKKKVMFIGNAGAGKIRVR